LRIAFLIPPAVDRTPLCARLAVAVGHEPQPVSGVRGADARCWKYDRPDGVTDTFQVSRNKVEPRPANRCINLFPKDDARAALLDEPVPGGPKVPLVSKRQSLACLAERLARRGTRPNKSISPSSQVERQLPAADSREKVRPVELPHVVWTNVPD
jgi:hypothetical protein